ncbi:MULTISPECIES: DUF2169 family type VI secretion system accessory protein [Proteus]|uniref:DUF2169 family type VI secretion system accessory protein n=1 Tax=Proteus TaxID=583 RepID=UPI00061D38E9|nr:MULTISPECIES: DUF2169 domain-containing protein [Proteus]AVA39942.1 DUF2169 domain-containing protein [Proteus mirabilis]EKU2830800.1 DUF2169 domain-containing protein [Proteus mirabilis]EKU4145918.1 DUF2169 domain-containing protein [Proteus mirabilis]ELA7211500.1 DUF2169 domain-containing protein [Proteus mirabilis]ELA7719397.1 DUF2169 domain-containing protein [Proteus mirabilis]
MLAHVINQTPFPHFSFEKLGYKDERWQTIVVKVTCDFDPLTGKCDIADEQTPLIMADVYRTTPENSSLVHETNLVSYKPHAEIYIVGTARTLSNTPVTHWETELSIGQIHKKLILSGPRYWEYHRDWSLGEAQPISALPLIYEKAFGGKNSHQEVNDKNPIGVGWYDSHDMDKTRQYPAPQIYYPLKEHILSVDKPWEVAGYGQYNRWWQQRVQFAGTYNDEWLNNIKPYYPADFNFAFFMSTPVDQQQNDFFVGNETLSLKGFFAQINLTELILPSIGFVVIPQLVPEKLTNGLLKLDTVCVSLDEQKLYLTWRYRQRLSAKENTLQLYAYKL